MKHFLFSCLFLFFTSLYSQQVNVVNFEKIQADLKFEDQTKISGSVAVKFKILEAVNSVYLDAIHMDFTNLELRTSNNMLLQGSDYHVEADKLIVFYDFAENENYILNFKYVAQPKKALYFIDDQIWSQGQGKYTSNWLPSIDDMNEKIEFDLSITYDADYSVLANGKLV